PTGGSGRGNSNAILRLRDSSRIRVCNPCGIYWQQAIAARRPAEWYAPTDTASPLCPALLVADSVIGGAHGGCRTAGWLQVSSGASDIRPRSESLDQFKRYPIVRDSWYPSSRVPSAIRAFAFYRCLGYRGVRSDNFHRLKGNLRLYRDLSREPC